MERRRSPDWPKIVRGWEALAIAAAADQSIHFKLPEESELPFHTLFERAQVMGLKPIELNVRLKKLELKLGTLPALLHGEALALRLIESHHTNSEKEATNCAGKSAGALSVREAMVLADSGKSLEPKLEAVRAVCKLVNAVAVEVGKNLNFLTVKVGAHIEGGNAEKGQIKIYVNDLMYDGPLRNMLKLGGGRMPRVQDQSEFSLFGYDQPLESRKRGLYSWGIHFSKERWRRQVAAMEEAKKEAVAAAIAAGAAQEQIDALQAPQELRDPTIEPIIELLFSRIDLEVYADAPPPGVPPTESFTQNSSLWRREDKIRSKTMVATKAFASE
jgi:hypothetical protein